MDAISKIGQFVQNQTARLRMRLAALYLFHDYKTDIELTAFSALDGEELFEDESSHPLIRLPKASADHRA